MAYPSEQLAKQAAVDMALNPYAYAAALVPAMEYFDTMSPISDEQQIERLDALKSFSADDISAALNALVESNLRPLVAQEAPTPDINITLNLVVVSTRQRLCVS